MYGQMCDVKSIKDAFPKDQKISIIEDCAHTFEAKFNGDRPGKYSDAAIFSFYATKNVTCGEGGAIITNDEKLFERIQQAILHGMSAGAADRFKAGQYSHWGMKHLGTKANLPDLLACFLSSQIENVDKNLNLRETISQEYESALKLTKIRIPITKNNVVHSRHLFPIYVGNKVRDVALNILGESGIGATVNYRDVPSMEYYKNKYSFQSGRFPISEKWGKGTLSIPLFPGLERTEIAYILKSLIEKINPLIEEENN
jgi:UDP-4-amino-4-deoxy-L-arabinose-oxoglutarate aminotransferase